MPCAAPKSMHHIFIVCGNRYRFVYRVSHFAWRISHCLSHPTNIYYVQLCNCPGSNPSAMRLSCRHITHTQRCPAGEIRQREHGRVEQPVASGKLARTMSTSGRRTCALGPNDLDFGHFENAQQSVGLELAVLAIDLMTDGLQYRGALVLQTAR